MDVWKGEASSFTDLQEQLTSDSCLQSCEVPFSQNSCSSLGRHCSHYSQFLPICLLSLLLSTVALTLFLIAFPYYPMAIRLPLILLTLLTLKEIVTYIHKTRTCLPGAPPLAKDLQEPVCPYCARMKVERASHCFTCGRCILRRDRHSCESYADVFGCCIGLNNARYFFLWLYWSSVGTGLAGIVLLYPAIQEESQWMLLALEVSLGVSVCVRVT